MARYRTVIPAGEARHDLGRPGERLVRPVPGIRIQRGTAAPPGGRVPAGTRGCMTGRCPRGPAERPATRDVFEDRTVDIDAALGARRIDRRRCRCRARPGQRVAAERSEAGIGRAVSDEATEHRGRASDVGGVPQIQGGGDPRGAREGAPIVRRVLMGADERVPDRVSAQDLRPDRAEPRSEGRVIAAGKVDDVGGEDIRAELTPEREGAVAGTDLLRADRRHDPGCGLGAQRHVVEPSRDECGGQDTHAVLVVLVGQVGQPQRSAGDIDHRLPRGPGRRATRELGLVDDQRAAGRRARTGPGYHEENGHGDERYERHHRLRVSPASRRCGPRGREEVARYGRGPDRQGRGFVAHGNTASATGRSSGHRDGPADARES